MFSSDLSELRMAVSDRRSTDYVCHDLFAEFLFAGRYPISAGTSRKTSGIDRRTAGKTDDHSTERARAKRRNSKRNDTESGSGAMFVGGDQGPRIHPGKIDPGNITSLCV